METKEFSRESGIDMTSTTTTSMEKENLQTCKECGKKFKRLISHKCKGENPHECPNCGQTFSRKAQLKKHLDSHR